MSKKKTQEQTTLVTFLLDRSSSMSSCYDATIEAFNGYVSTLKDAKTPILFTFLQFDHNGTCCLEKVHFQKPIKDIPDLDRTNYQPRGSTPLIEASIKTIEALDNAISSMKSEKPKVVVCIQTDGEENASSKEHTWDRLKKLVEAKTKEGWQFNFMGAGIDAYAQGIKMGFTVANTISYDHTDKVATRSAFVASAQNSALYASGALNSTSYSVEQKIAAGDRYQPGTPKKSNPVVTQGLSWSSPVQNIVNAPLDLGGTPDKFESLDLTTE